MSQRHDDEQHTMVQQTEQFFNARNETDMIASSRKVVQGLFGEAAVTEFSEEVIGHSAAGNLPDPSHVSDETAKIYHFIKVSVGDTFFSKLVQSYASLSPHSIGPERALSCHTALQGPKQSSYTREAINSRMAIALNSTGTAHFDPRPSVARFIQKKARRYTVPDEELYRERDFVKKFFTSDSDHLV